MWQDGRAECLSGPVFYNLPDGLVTNRLATHTDPQVIGIGLRLRFLRSQCWPDLPEIHLQLWEKKFRQNPVILPPSLGLACLPAQGPCARAMSLKVLANLDQRKGMDAN